MNVIAKKGLKVPMEKNPRKYISDAAAVNVPETHYYLMAVRMGDLVDTTNIVHTQSTQQSVKGDTV